MRATWLVFSGIWSVWLSPEIFKIERLKVLAWSSSSERESRGDGERILKTYVLWDPAALPLLIGLKYAPLFPKDQMRAICVRKLYWRCLTPAQEEHLERPRDYSPLPSNRRICIKWPSGNKKPRVEVAVRPNFIAQVRCCTFRLLRVSESTQGGSVNFSYWPSPERTLLRYYQLRITCYPQTFSISF